MKTKTIYHNLFGSFSTFIFLLFTGIFLLPYYFQYISVNDYGIWLGGISFISLLTVLEANISLILTQQLGERWVKRESLEFSKYFSASIFFSVVVSLIIIVGGASVSYFCHPEKRIDVVGALLSCFVDNGSWHMSL